MEPSGFKTANDTTDLKEKCITTWYEEYKYGYFTHRFTTIVDNLRHKPSKNQQKEKILRI